MKFAWITADGKEWDTKKQFITTALESGIEYVVDFTDIDRIKKLGNLTLVSDIDDSDIILIGRNIFQAPSPRKTTKAIAEIVHNNMDVDDALKILNGKG